MSKGFSVLNSGLKARLMTGGCLMAIIRSGAEAGREEGLRPGTRNK